jgi:D-alanyl-D-alanine carboxypeptidase
MRNLIAGNIMLAAAKPATATHRAGAHRSLPASFPLPLPEPAENSEPATNARLASAESAPLLLTSSESEATAAIPPNPGSHAPIKPIRVKTYPVKLVPSKHAGSKPEAAAKPSPAPAKADDAPPRHRPIGGGWAIQVGAFEDESEAKERLSSAQSRAGNLLGKANRYTERTTKGEKTYYRARFAGFDREGAQQACRQLKRNDIDCMAFKI